MVIHHQIAPPPVSSGDVLVVNWVDEAVGVSLRDPAVVVSAVHGGGEVPLDSSLGVLKVLTKEANLEVDDEALEVGRAVRVGIASQLSRREQAQDMNVMSDDGRGGEGARGSSGARAGVGPAGGRAQWQGRGGARERGAAAKRGPRAGGRGQAKPSHVFFNANQL